MTKKNRRNAIPANYDGSTPLPNARWELFCLNFTGLYQCNASASYRAAGYHCEGDRSDSACALKLLTNAYIQKRIDHLNAKRMEALRFYACMAKERLTAIATAKYTDYQGPNGDVDIEKVRDPRLSQAVEYCTPLYDKEGGFLGYRLKLYDPYKAMEMLGWSEEKKEQMQAQNNMLIINA